VIVSLLFDKFTARNLEERNFQTGAVSLSGGLGIYRSFFASQFLNISL